MKFETRFGCLRQTVEDAFAKAKADAGLEAEQVKLVLTDEKLVKFLRSRVGFSVLSDGTVQVTWAAIGAMWLTCHAAARLGVSMFEGRRSGVRRLDVNPGSPQDVGLLLLDVAKQMMKVDEGPEKLGTVRWPDELPQPDSPTKDEHSIYGATIFGLALQWALRHELAHIALRHDAREYSKGLSPIQIETEADDQASDWLRKGLKADENRELGAVPSNEEVQLERVALGAGIALLWVSTFESAVGIASRDHPPVAERMFQSLDRFSLREDSFAGEMLTDLVKAMVDPQGEWPDATNSRETLHEALTQLQRFMAQFRQ